MHIDRRLRQNHLEMETNRQHIWTVDIIEDLACRKSHAYFISD